MITATTNPNEILSRRNEITEKILDVVCDRELSLGESLTILRQVKKTLERQIHELTVTIERQTGTRRSP